MTLALTNPWYQAARGFGSDNSHADDLEGDWRLWVPTIFPEYCTFPFAPHHVDFWDWLWSIERGETVPPHVDIWARGGAKSSSAEMGCVALACRDKRRYGLYISETQDQADEHVETLGAMLESPQIAELYPMMARRDVTKYGSSRGWRRNRLRTATGFTIDALGLDKKARGVKFEEQRPDFMVLDDLDAEDDTLAATEKKLRTLSRKILPAGARDLVVLAIQNLIIQEGIFARLAGVASTPAEILSDRIVSGPIPAVRDLTYVEREGDWLITGGTPTWDGQDLEQCQKFVNRFGISAFLSECQHDVEAPPGGMFDHLSFARCAVEQVPHLVRTTVWVDPAVTNTDSSDSQAIQADGLGVDDRIYRLRSYEHRGSPREALKKAILWAVEFGSQTVGVETDQGGDTWEDTYTLALDDAKKEVGLRRASEANWPAFTYDKASKQAGQPSKAARAAQMLVDYERPGNRIIHVEGTHLLLERALHRFPKTKPFDLCLAAGSLVETDRGALPIEQVSAGDRVVTRAGWRSVLAAGMTSPSAELWELLTEDGHRLVGTEAHPVLTERGWRPLWAATDAKIWTWSRPSTSSTAAGDIAGIPTPSSGPTGSTTPAVTVEALPFIDRSGSTISDRSQTGTTSTIATTTRSTTTRAISRFSPPQPIGHTTAGLGTTSTPWLLTWRTFARWLLSGIGRRTAGPGIVSTGSERGSGRSIERSSAPSAESRSSLAMAGTPSFARALVATPLRPATPPTTSAGRANCVAPASTPGSTTAPGFALSSVVTVRSLRVAAPVYNLTVEADPEFVAGGVLVHNCDASYWAWKDLREGQAGGQRNYKDSRGAGRR